MEEKAKDLASLGEFGLIRHLTENLVIKNAETILAVGDDAAVIDPAGMQVVVTTDLLTEGIHFDLIYTPLKHLGYKSVVVNLSDVYSMNAIPKQITVALAVSSKFTLEMIEELYAGIRLACDRYGVDLIGGDTSTSLTGMTISITALGYASADQLVYRNGARENDLICVTGDLGAAYLGLLLLEREKRVFANNPQVQPQFAGYDYPLERFLKPEAGRGLIEMLRSKGIKPTSMIDISDGLSSEILHICQQSQVGCRIYEDKLPIDMVSLKLAEEMNLVSTTAVMNGGEDYELLFTIAPEDYDKIKDEELISVIGHITNPEKGYYLITQGDAAIELKAQGWNHGA